MKWTREETCKSDGKICKLLTTHGFHHPKSSIHHLHLHQSHGGQGLTGIETNHDCKCSALTKYVMESTNALTQIVCDTQTPTQKFLLKFTSRPKYLTPTMADDTHYSALLEKPMHGKFFTQQKDIPQ
eukprot:14239267-Ditylum_brightwellii.AAC.1